MEVLTKDDAVKLIRELVPAILNELRAQEPESRLLTAKEVARIFNKHEQTIYRLHRKGVLPSVPTGDRTIGFDPDVIAKIKADGFRKALPGDN